MSKLEISLVRDNQMYSHNPGNEKIRCRWYLCEESDQREAYVRERGYNNFREFYADESTAVSNKSGREP